MATEYRYRDRAKRLRDKADKLEKRAILLSPTPIMDAQMRDMRQWVTTLSRIQLEESLKATAQELADYVEANQSLASAREHDQAILREALPWLRSNVAAARVRLESSPLYGTRSDDDAYAELYDDQLQKIDAWVEATK